MGYTHYWTKQRAFTQKEWASLIGITSLLLQKAPGKTATAGGYHKDDPLEIQRDWDDERPPEVTKERIWFNGAGDLGHETFALMQNEVGFNYCKTARKPYDLLCCAVLLAAHEIAPDAIALGTDGEVEDWKPAAEFFEEATGLSVKLEEIFPQRTYEKED